MILEAKGLNGKANLEKVLTDYKEACHLNGDDGLFEFKMNGDKAIIIGLPPTEIKEIKNTDNE